MLLLLACTGDGPAETPAPADDTGEPADVDVPFDEELGEELTAALNSGLEDRNVVGMAMALKLPGTELFITAVGTSDLETERAMEATDRFRIASISKTFTATVVLQLVDEGGEYSGSACANRVTQCNRPTVRVHDATVEIGPVLQAGQRLRGKGFDQLDDGEIGPANAGTVERGMRRLHRTDAEPVRIHAAHRATEHSGHRLASCGGEA